MRCLGYRANQGGTVEFFPPLTLSGAVSFGSFREWIGNDMYRIIKMSETKEDINI
jgi:hypothetical protein